MPKSADEDLKVDVRGRITVPLDGVDYMLRPSREAITACETQLGRSLLCLAGEAVRGALSVEDLAIICAEMMKAEGKADPDAGPSYKGAKASRIADLIFEAGAPSVTARVAVVLMGALTGGYTASGEPKPTT